ncbi:hypothetical protein RQP53_19570 [Paucibacter sp. APW11]|uniref:Uncharacterized protein n=1 Tax=Roseateles aquae TaxID=3077235 RepID=A0ABU3PFW8_9BURK|nr:hypothetical protein [Paucibacter sp. APW11]MDT9001485.1 hypothetical protein [Paucibacter sp. APW11]
MTLLALKVHSPRKVDSKLKRLLRELGLPASEVLSLPFTEPSDFMPEAANCHFNVLAQVKLAGGRAVHGWILAEDRKQDFVEAVFHSVWQPVAGPLRDLTPRSLPEAKILFVPDPRRRLVLTTESDRPAILTYENFRMHEGRALAPLRQVRLPVCSTLIARFELWPWQDQSANVA